MITVVFGLIMFFAGYKVAKAERVVDEWKWMIVAAGAAIADIATTLHMLYGRH